MTGPFQNVRIRKYVRDAPNPLRKEKKSCGQGALAVGGGGTGDVQG